MSKFCRLFVSLVIVLAALQSIGQAQLTNTTLDDFPATKHEVLKCISQVLEDRSAFRFREFELELYSAFIGQDTLREQQNTYLEMRCIGHAIAGRKANLAALIQAATESEKSGCIWLSVNYLLLAKHFANAKELLEENQDFRTNTLKRCYLNAECTYNTQLAAFIRELSSEDQLRRWKDEYAEFIAAKQMITQASIKYGSHWQTLAPQSIGWYLKNEKGEVQSRELFFKILQNESLDDATEASLRADTETYWLWVLSQVNELEIRTIKNEVWRSDNAEIADAYGGLISADPIVAFDLLDADPGDNKDRRVQILAGYARSLSDNQVVALANQFVDKRDRALFLLTFLTDFYRLTML